MKKKHRPLGAVLFALLLAAGITACSNSFDTSSSSQENLTGEAKVSFTLNSKRVSARTALPSLDMSSYTFTILATSTTGTVKTLAEGLSSDNLAQTFSLAREIWTFTVQAFTAITEENTSATLVLEGSSAEIDLQTQNTAQVDLTLTAATSGTGSVSIPITYDTKGVGSVNVGLYTKAIGGTLVDGTEQTFTASDGITQNEDGSWSFTYTASNLPSGTTYYACFTLCDEAGEVAGYYTEAVYIIAGETSAPVLYVYDENGEVTTDANGDPVIDTETTAIAVEPNLFTTTVSYEAVDTENGESRELIVKNTATEKEYTLYDEDGDGVYDNALPPGNYTVVTVKTTDASGETTTTDVSGESIALAVSTNVEENTTVAAKLGSVAIAIDGAASATVSSTLSLTAVASDSSVLAESLYTVQWYTNTAASTTSGTPISGATGTSYTIPVSCEGLYIYAVVTQTNNSLTASSTPLLVAKGSIDSSALTVTYGSGTSAVTLYANGTASSLALTLSDGEATVDESLLTVSGATDAISGSAISPSAAFSATSFTVNGSATVTVSLAGYESVSFTLPVTVKAATPTAETAPALSTNVAYIAIGCIQFEVDDDTTGIYEYSIDGGNTWVTLTEETSIFEVADSVTSVLVRVKAVTTDDGTIEASEAFTVTIAEENRGTQITLESVALSYPDASGTLTVGKTLGVSTTSNNGSTATTGLSYQWQRADTSSASDSDFVDIDGATASTYTLSQADFGKSVRVKVTQAEVSICSEATTANITAGALSDTWTITYTAETVSYEVDGEALPIKITLSGSDSGATATIPTGSTLSVNSATDAVSGNTVSGATATFVTPTAYTTSGTVQAVISASGYTDKTITLAVLVAAAAPQTSAIPALSTDATNVSAGAIAFSSASSTLEYSIDDGATYTAITTSAFCPASGEAWQENDTLLVRVKESGSASAGTYIAPSETVEITVSAANIGTRPAVSIGTITYSGDIALAEPVVNENTVTITVENPSLFTAFAWKKDGVLISGETDSSLTLDTSAWVEGTYNITVVGTNGSYQYSATVPVTKN